MPADQGNTRFLLLPGIFNDKSSLLGMAYKSTTFVHTGHVTSRWQDGSAYYNQHTLFFFVTFGGTDLVQAPALR
ncbi:MAG: hypothetical protein P0111_07910 [Nitrospira sp.]|nr:hypothetical protein [Nitrospira sp.]